MNFKQNKTHEFLNTIKAKNSVSRKDVVDFENDIGENIVSENYNIKNLTTEASSNGYKEVYELVKGYYDEIDGGSVLFNRENYNKALGETSRHIYKLVSLLKNAREVLTAANVDKYLKEDTPWVLKEDVPTELLNLDIVEAFLQYNYHLILDALEVNHEELTAIRNRTYFKDDILVRNYKISPIFEMLVSNNLEMISLDAFKVTPPGGVSVTLKMLIELLDNSEVLIERLEEKRSYILKNLTNPKSYYTFSNNAEIKQIFKRVTKFNMMAEEDEVFKAMCSFFSSANLKKMYK